MSSLFNIGSISKIEIALASSVILTQANYSFQVKVLSNPQWEDIPFTFESASFSQIEKESDEGTLFNATLQFRSPKFTKENFSNFSNYLSKDLAFRITDGNGTVFLIGDMFFPAHMARSPKIPEKTAGYNGVSLSVKCLSNRPALFPL